jgi:Cu(I)/Ag(I) efflux system membrane fusion protein
MTMDFRPPGAGLPKNIVQGANVVFEFKQQKEGQYQLTTIAPAAQTAPDAKAMKK